MADQRSLREPAAVRFATKLRVTVEVAMIGTDKKGLTIHPWTIRKCQNPQFRMRSRKDAGCGHVDLIQERARRGSHLSPETATAMRAHIRHGDNLLPDSQTSHRAAPAREQRQEARGIARLPEPFCVSRMQSTLTNRKDQFYREMLLILRGHPHQAGRSGRMTREH